MNSAVIQSTLKRVSTLATLPDVAVRIMRIADDPAATEDAVHDVLMSDPALATRVLKVVNSAFYRRQREVTTPRAAIRLLGVEAIRSIALAAGMQRLFRTRVTIPGFDPAALWTHSMAVGVAARAISRRTGIGLPEEAMLAGLLHDIGFIVAMQAWLSEFAVIVRRVQADGAEQLRAIELEEIGATHEEFGAALCEKWNFPDFLLDACRYHHNFSTAHGNAAQWGALVNAADSIAHRLGEGLPSGFENEEMFSQALTILGIDAQTFAELEEEAQLELPQAVLLVA